MRVAAAQTAPQWGDSQGTTKIAVDWIGRAADDGVELLAFGETFLPGYPYWLSRTDGAKWDDPDQKRAYAFYLEAALSIDGPELAEIVTAATDHKVFTYIGVAERSRSRGSVYATLVAIDPERGIVSAHRKLMPTYDERMVWGPGDGHGLRVHTYQDLRVGGLNCWENWIPLARHALYSQGVDLHVAVWPGSIGLTKDITRFIAKEGRCYVLSAGAILRPDDIALEFPLRDRAVEEAEEYFFTGGSCIAAPTGEWIIEPIGRQEALVVADIDVSLVRGERQNFDPAGHYLRADVLQLKVDRNRLEPASFDG